MAMIEIDETEVAALRGQVQHLGNYAKVVEALKGNPEARTLFQAAIKKVKPDAPIAEYDTRTIVAGALQEVQKQVGGLTKVIESFKADQESAKFDSEVTKKVDEGRAYLRRRGRTQEGIAAVEKLMADRGLADYEAGDATFDRLNPPQEMAVPGIQKGWELFEPSPNASDDLKLLMSGGKDRVGDAYVRTMVPQILNEIRSGKAA